MYIIQCIAFQHISHEFSCLSFKIEQTLVCAKLIFWLLSKILLFPIEPFQNMRGNELSEFQCHSTVL